MTVDSSGCSGDCGIPTVDSSQFPHFGNCPTVNWGGPLALSYAFLVGRAAAPIAALPMLRHALGRGGISSIAIAGLVGTSSALVLSTDSAPVDRLGLVAPFPDGDATGTTLRLQEIAAGRPVVLHLFTG
jgi:hypothetical protein|eukprot:448339-Prymnesium_polylepis.2